MPCLQPQGYRRRTGGRERLTPGGSWLPVLLSLSMNVSYDTYILHILWYYFNVKLNYILKILKELNVS